MEHTVTKSGLGTAALMTLLAAATAAIALTSLFIGYAPLPAADIIGGLFTDQGTTTGIIMREIRLPRMLLGLLAGAALGMSGAALQGLLRNPLAEPGVMGIASFASLGAVIAIYFGISTSFSLALPILAMSGALIAAALLSLFASRENSVLTLILAGVALANLAAALMALALNLAPNPYALSEIVFWLLGSLKDRSLDDVFLSAPFVALGLALLASSGRALDALTLGEDAAKSLGIEVASISRRVTLGVALAVGASVAVTGAIAFVGLIVPHLCRPFFGHVPSKLLWPSALGGALLVSVADVAVRLVPSGPELMLGVFTSLIGVPFFLWLIFKLRREMQ
ncbi:MAG: iron ABC transporter permease [Alphaproteobacteria bacterium]|nr:iron ABC transporter permease [Alphaproteobacteria bacterium]